MEILLFERSRMHYNSTNNKTHYKQSNIKKIVVKKQHRIKNLRYFPTISPIESSKSDQIKSVMLNG